MPSRHFRNHNKHNICLPILSSSTLLENGLMFLDHCVENCHTGSIYTGLSGCSLTEYQYGAAILSTDHDKGIRHIRKALSLAEHNIRDTSSRRVTLLEGRLGPIVICLFCATALGDISLVNKCIADIIRVGEQARNLPRSECEVLYGRCGYLQAILAAKCALRDLPELSSVFDEISEHIVREVYEEGLSAPMVASERQPLCWKWHDKIYLGACHGVAGILYTLLLFPVELQAISGGSGMSNVLETIRWLKSLMFESGNLPSSHPPGRDRLVQWCHGAPGMVHLLCLAARVFPSESESMLRCAQAACDCIWDRGLLHKGMGLCHGIAGNGYCLLAYANILKTLAENTGSTTVLDGTPYLELSDIYTRRAHAFAEFIILNRSELERVPDHPYSMFEGMCGAASLLIDMALRPGYEAFPGYDFL